jgi:Tol biopolymer transport system component
LLVSGGAQTWIVSADGARRQLGHWRAASWSPHGRYIAVASGEELAAVNPRGVMQWALRRPAVSDPRWYAPSGFRVAYRSQNTLRVVAGDGTGDRQLAAGVAPVAPAWRPAHPYQLAYITHRRVVLTDADSGRMLWERPADDASKLQWSADGARLLIVARNDARVLTGAGETVASIATGPGPLLDGSLSPDGQAVALVRDGLAPGTITARLGSPRPHLSTVLSGPGMRQVLWSPNGRWLLISWPAANQWAFVTVAGNPRIAATSRIAQQFLRGPHRDSFPRLDGWCCTAYRRSG